MRAHPALTEEHEAWRDTVRRFVERDLWTPVADAIGWLEARALWARFGL